MAKSERTSISFAGELMDPMDRVVAESFGNNRSAYVDAVVRADLERRGRLVISREERALAKAKAALAAWGPVIFEACLDDFLREKVADRAATATTAEVLP